MLMSANVNIIACVSEHFLSRKHTHINIKKKKNLDTYWTVVRHRAEFIKMRRLPHCYCSFDVCVPPCYTRRLNTICNKGNSPSLRGSRRCRFYVWQFIIMCMEAYFCRFFLLTQSVLFASSLVSISVMPLCSSI